MAEPSPLTEEAHVGRLTANTFFLLAFPKRMHMSEGLNVDDKLTTLPSGSVPLYHNGPVQSHSDHTHEQDPENRPCLGQWLTPNHYSAIHRFTTVLYISCEF